MKKTTRFITSALAAVMLVSGSTVTAFAEPALPAEFTAVSDYIPTEDERYYPGRFKSTEEQPHIGGYYAWSDGVLIDVLAKYSKDMPDGWDKDHDYHEDQGYNCIFQAKIDGKWKNIGKDFMSKGSSAVLNGLKPYTGYTIRVCIPHYGDNWNNKEGFKAYSETIKIRTEPAQVKIKSTSKSKTAVRINWKKVKCQGYKIQQYDASLYKKWKTVATVRDQNITTARISKLKSGTKYKFRVIAYGRTLDKYPVLENDSDPVQPPYYTHLLWGRASKAVAVTTKK